MTVVGRSPKIAGAQLTLSGEHINWMVEDNPTSVEAGSGIAAAIVDLVFRHHNESDPHTSIATASAHERERSIPVDQTHTSVIVDDQWVVKIVGSWGASDRSAAILERLKQHHATVTPELAGTIQWEHPEHGTATVALVTAYIPDSTDGWTWAVEDTLDYLQASATGINVGLPDWPRQLGVLTGHMHNALVIDENEPHDEDPRAHDRAQAETVFDAVFDIIDDDDKAQRSEAFHDKQFLQRTRARKEALASAVASIPDAASGPLMIPHGDYHVGQLLRTSDGAYLVLDFDGDPQWDETRRLRPDGAARDVAHMLVSLDIVAAVIQRRLGHADERAWQWATTAQQQFLDAYRDTVPPGFLDPAPLRGLVAEQLLHELLYAEHFLPRWRYAADGVISRRYPAHTPKTGSHFTEDELYYSLPEYTPNPMEQPWNPPVSPTT